MIIKVLIPLLLLIALPTLLAQAHKENVSGPFENAKQVTEECLMCNEDSGKQILASNQMSSDNALKCTAYHGKGGEGLLNWKELGYPDDPIKKSGRVKNKLIKK